jgi:hypothetical protein
LHTAWPYGIKLEFSNERSSRKYLNTWRLNNMLLHDHRVIKKFVESRENESTTYRNLCDITKAVLRGMFIGMNAYTKKHAQISNK